MYGEPPGIGQSGNSNVGQNWRNDPLYNNPNVADGNSDNAGEVGFSNRDTVASDGKPHPENKGGKGNLTDEQLARLNPDNPNIQGNKSEVGSKPPAGLSGLGNPFFNPSPMVAFFKYFGAVQKVMKLILALSTSFAMKEQQLVLRSSKDDAAMTIKAADAQSDSLKTQAYIQFGMAIVGAVFLIFSLKSIQNARGAAKQEKDRLKDAVAEKEGDVAKADNAIVKKEAQIKAKNAFKNGARAPDEVQIKDETVDVAKNQTQKGQKKTADKAVQKDQVKIQEEGKKAKNADDLDEAASIEKEELKKLTSEAKGKNQDEIKELSDTSRDEKDLQILKKEQSKAKSEWQSAKSSLEAFFEPNMVSRIMETDMVHVMSNAILSPQGVLNNILGAFSKLAEAKGTTESAAATAQGKLYSAFTQIFQRGLDAMMQGGQDAQQVFEDIYQALKKLSDQQQMFHWSG